MIRICGYVAFRAERPTNPPMHPPRSCAPLRGLAGDGQVASVSTRPDGGRCPTSGDRRHRPREWRRPRPGPVGQRERGQPCPRRERGRCGWMSARAGGLVAAPDPLAPFATALLRGRPRVDNLVHPWLADRDDARGSRRGAAGLRCTESTSGSALTAHREHVHAAHVEKRIRRGHTTRLCHAVFGEPCSLAPDLGMPRFRHPSAVTPQLLMHAHCERAGRALLPQSGGEWPESLDRKPPSNGHLRLQHLALRGARMTAVPTPPRRQTGRPELRPGQPGGAIGSAPAD